VYKALAIVAVLLGLAAAVVALRAAGMSVGWGFQFQEPIFLAAICTLLVVFAKNLFGVFEVTFQPSGPKLEPSGGVTLDATLEVLREAGRETGA